MTGLTVSCRLRWQVSWPPSPGRHGRTCCAHQRGAGVELPYGRTISL